MALSEQFQGRVFMVSQATIIDMAIEAQGIASQLEPEAIPRHADIGRLASLASSIFDGLGIQARTLDPEDTPITAYYQTSGYFVDPKWKVQNGLFLKAHPQKAVGSIKSVNLLAGSVQVRPWRFSPYAFDRGCFIIDLLTDDNEPRVKSAIG